MTVSNAEITNEVVKETKESKEENESNSFNTDSIKSIEIDSTHEIREKSPARPPEVKNNFQQVQKTNTANLQPISNEF